MRNLKYRPEIDGLRAIAVFGVIFYHAGFVLFKGGFLGVDVFFVISGFLITNIILLDIKNKNFSLKSFYLRRARRILPVLFLTILLTIPLSFLIMYPESLEYFGKTILRVNFFVSNFWFNNTTNYFNNLASHSPLLHTWSLAVEEQFYIVYPLFVLLFFKFFKIKHFLFTLILLVLSSILFSSYASVFKPTFNFFIIFSRFFELGIGAITALLVLNNKFPNINFLRNIFFLLIIFSFSFFSEKNNMPNYLSLIPTISTALLIIFLEDRNSILYKVLSSNFLVFLGKISYSLYLFHFPIFVFLADSNFYIKILVIIGIIPFSFLSYKYIENSFRDSKKISTKNFSIFIISYLIISTIIGFVFRETNGLEKYNLGRYNPEEFLIIKSVNDAKISSNDENIFDDQSCKFWSENLTSEFVQRFNDCKKKFKKAIFILGDSHGIDLYNALYQNSNYPFIVSISQDECRPHTENIVRQCHHAKTREFLKKFSSNIRLLIFTDKGSYYLENGINLPIKKELILKTREYLESIQIGSSKVVWMGPNIEPNIDLDKKNASINIIKNKQFSLLENKNINFLDKILIKELTNSEVSYISKIDLMKYDSSQDWYVENKITYSDKDHWSTFGEKYFGKRIFNSEVFLNLLKE